MWQDPGDEFRLHPEGEEKSRGTLSRGVAGTMRFKQIPLAVSKGIMGSMGGGGQTSWEGTMVTGEGGQ